MTTVNNAIEKIWGIDKGGQPSTAAFTANNNVEDNPVIKKKETIPMVAYNTSFVGGLGNVSVFNAQQPSVT